MFIGHAFLAFTLVAAVAARRGSDTAAAVRLGTIAALFSLLPDIDIIHTWTALGTLLGAGITGFPGAFWEASRAAHRGLSHSVVTGLVGAAAFTVYHRMRRPAVAAAVIAGLTGMAYAVGGTISAGVAVVFAVAGLGLTAAVQRRMPTRQTAFFAAAATGLIVHPFTDLFTGSPPAILAPFPVTLFPQRIVLWPEPTVNLVAVFLLEIGLILTGVLTYLYLTGRPPTRFIHPAAGIGVLFVAVAPVLRPPTVTVSYQFVYAILAVGLLAGAVSAGLWDASQETGRKEQLFAALLTGPVAVILGSIAYVAGYWWLAL
ncbi:MAG: metal-dependent hydrolase [Candidatus Nanohaloarchaea archaeon]|nr:metal-dependent hydrolase [Candidatus Nanohaloarchaea archaeon]